jgi:hypothetical protein
MFRPSLLLKLSLTALHGHQCSFPCTLSRGQHCVRPTLVGVAILKVHRLILRGHGCHKHATAGIPRAPSGDNVTRL